MLHLFPTFEGGGAERQQSLLSPALPERDLEVQAAFLRDGSNTDRLASRLDSGAAAGKMAPTAIIGSEIKEIVHICLVLFPYLLGGTCRV
jgi:hypothetical protein